MKKSDRKYMDNVMAIMGMAPIKVTKKRKKQMKKLQKLWDKITKD